MPFLAHMTLEGTDVFIPLFPQRGIRIAPRGESLVLENRLVNPYDHDFREYDRLKMPIRPRWEYLSRTPR